MAKRPVNGTLSLVDPMQSGTTHARCTAKSKRSGEQCKNPPITGRQTCRMHNGHAGSGIGSASFKTGRYSKDIPAHLAQRYDDARSDPDLLSLRDEIAATEARLSELFSRLSTGESQARMDSLAFLHGELHAALLAQDSAERELHLKGIAKQWGDVLRQVYSDAHNWTEIDQHMMLRARLIESEQRRLVAMQQLMTAEQAMTYSAALAAAVKRRADEHMDDEPTRRAFLRDVANDMRAFADREGHVEAV